MLGQQGECVSDLFSSLHIQLLNLLFPSPVNVVDANEALTMGVENKDAELAVD